MMAAQIVHRSVVADLRRKMVPKEGFCMSKQTQQPPGIRIVSVPRVLTDQMHLVIQPADIVNRKISS